MSKQGFERTFRWIGKSNKLWRTVYSRVSSDLSIWFAFKGFTVLHARLQKFVFNNHLIWSNLYFIIFLIIFLKKIGSLGNDDSDAKDDAL